MDSECDEILQILVEQRKTLLITVRGLTDAEAAKRSTVSELTLGGLIKHLTSGERVWTQIMIAGDGTMPDGMLDMGQYKMNDGETLADLIEQYRSAARATDEAFGALTDLATTVPLPQTPWSPPETVWWSARRILLHLIRETTQHAGHADIIRESIDGASTTAQW